MRTLFKKSIFFISFLTLLNCSPILIPYDDYEPLPPWFYPNRIESIRYVYFPEHSIYYDITLRNYIYYDHDRWSRSRNLPSRYNDINLNRSRYQRIRNYHEDDIGNYHDSHRKRG